jgi:hypothetical protein
MTLALRIRADSACSADVAGSSDAVDADDAIDVGVAWPFQCLVGTNIRANSHRRSASPILTDVVRSYSRPRA